MSKKYKQRIILNVIEDGSRWERESGENLYEKFDENPEVTQAFERNQLIPVNVPRPTSLQMAQSNKAQILETVKSLAPVSNDSILYVIGHCDGETKRVSGLEVSDWAEIIGSGAFNKVKRVHIVGCQSAGEVKSAEEAMNSKGTLPYSVTGFFSFAGLLHDYLKRYGIRTEVAAYCSYVKVSAFGEIRSGFKEGGAHKRHTPATKVVFSWTDESSRAMRFTRFE